MAAKDKFFEESSENIRNQTKILLSQQNESFNEEVKR